MDTSLVNKYVSLWLCLYVLSNIKAIFEAQFMKKLSNTKGELRAFNCFFALTQPRNNNVGRSAIFFFFGGGGGASLSG